MPRSGKLVVVGVVLGAHGVRGDVRVKSFTEDPAAVFDYGPLVAEDGDVLLDPVSARAVRDHFIVRPATPRQKEDWDALKGARLHVARDAFEAAGEDEFYVEDLVGLAVFENGVGVGRVKAVQNYGAGDLLEIAPEGGGKTVFVPFTEADVPSLDLSQGRIDVADFAFWADESAAPGQDG